MSAYDDRINDIRKLFDAAPTREHRQEMAHHLASLEQAKAWETIGESARSIAASIDALCNALATKR